MKKDAEALAPKLRAVGDRYSEHCSATVGTTFERLQVVWNPTIGMGEKLVLCPQTALYVHPVCCIPIIARQRSVFRGPNAA